MSFKVIDVSNIGKLVSSACYDAQQVCVYLQSFSCWSGWQWQKSRAESRGSELTLLKSTFNAENFVCRLS